MNLHMKLFGYAPNSSSDVVLIGSANPIAGTYDLWNDNIQVGDIDLELTHSYGSFGYGYSPQLKDEDMTPEEIVTYSLFPRVIPKRDKRELENPVAVVCATPHPQYIDFKEHVYLSYGREIKEQLEEAAESMYMPTLFQREMGGVHHIRNEKEEITVGLQDETNMEGDTQHRVLISKEYMRFANSAAIFENSNNRESFSSVSNGLSAPILISPPVFPTKDALKTVAEARRKTLRKSWGSQLPIWSAENSLSPDVNK
ncbi:hypothetical protein HK100_004872 [Physocladia obscura]|uniref:Uncharacterized protein n=1 Tax=Physocladia obscura TaxID=109957 RepID=A0AAD5SSG9_9FUNG|nr:hypothetical protein HK100_004872 [Physocladia obscura]